MRLKALLAASILLFGGGSFSEQSRRRLLSNRVHIFYYAWYGNPERDGRYEHWDQGRRVPPEDLASSFYPKLGAYSSSDPAVLRQHFSWIASTGIGVLAYAWQQRGDLSDRALPLVMEVAREEGLKVAFLIDQNPPKSPVEVLEGVGWLTARFGGHPSFYRIRHPTRWSPSLAERGVFYLFDPYRQDQVSPSEWAPLVDLTRDTYYDVILLGQGFDVSKAEAAHFDGVFTFDILKAELGLFQVLSQQARTGGLIFVPTVGPGYDDRRAVSLPAGVRPRQQGRTFDDFWNEVLSVNPEWASVNSFNEWHEGTQIEPAVPREGFEARYEDYRGAYELGGEQAETAYLRRAQFWLEKFGLASVEIP